MCRLVLHVFSIVEFWSIAAESPDPSRTDHHHRESLVRDTILSSLGLVQILQESQVASRRVNSLHYEIG